MAEIKTNKFIENSVRDNFIKAMKDSSFISLAKKLGVSEKELMHNTSKLQDTLLELNNCSKCKCLASCKNKEIGFINYPEVYHDRIIFSYIACKYKKEFLRLEEEKKTASKVLENATLKDIDILDSKRTKLIKWVFKFVKNYDVSKNNKGLYLHGNFGCGKTYIISAMFNELKKSGYSTEIVYFPTLLRDLKSNFDLMGDVMDELCNVTFLLIDDIGAEKVSDWGRDEILGTILQERMNNMKTTFFTSNFNITELEKHLSNNGTDLIKASRIIERIKQLTTDIEMISENRRD